MTKRILWIDLLKIISMFLVIILHVVDYGVNDGNKNIGLLLYYFGVFAIPLFFMVNGYLLLSKNNITYKYIWKKIKKIMIIVFGWNIIIFLIKLVLKNNITNIFVSVINNFLQRGYFFQFWFLGSLIIIYLILPLLQKILLKVKLENVIILLIIFCTLVDFINIFRHLNNLPIIKDCIIQTFRLWTWITYFCLGGFILKRNLLENISIKKHFIMLLCLIFSSIIFEYFMVDKFYGNLYAENFYDNPLIIFTTIIIFTFFKKISFIFNIHNSIITKLSQLTMGVYIIHPTIINFVKIFNLNNNFFNLIILMPITFISFIVAYIIYKIPKLNNLIRL